MNLIKLITIISTFILVLVPLTIFSENVISSKNQYQLETVIIRIAQYPHYAGCDGLFDLIFNYQWESNGTIYSFNLTTLTLDELSGKGEKALNVDNFDLLLTGATFDSFYKHGSDKELLNNIRDFVSNGGGYQSVCAGTVFSTQGYEKPNRLYKLYINRHTLKIANVYLNLDWSGEAQYIFKMGMGSGGLVPIENKVVKNSSNPIFRDYPKDIINISYGGGPGIYPADIDNPIYGDITPLLIINEELMDTKPIHWYIKGLLPGWIPFRKVKTDIKGQYAAIATTYGEGRIVIYNAHPEIILVVNGTIDQYMGEPVGYGFGETTLPPMRAVFSWTGTPLNMSHNWWIHRRTAAWIAGVPDDNLPPCNELMAFIDKPTFRFGIKEFYFNGEGLIYGIGNNSVDGTSDVEKPSVEIARKIVEWTGMTTIAGNINVLGYAEGSDRMDFYVDGELQYTDYEAPFSWKIENGNLTGVHNIEVCVYDEYGNYAYDGSDFFFITI